MSVFCTDFNPRPLAGATQADAAKIMITLFQSTPPCGGDPFNGSTGKAALLFQSTPPCGGDVKYLYRYPRKNDFNPRPLAGATVFALVLLFEYSDFNPRPLAGATIDGVFILGCVNISIHAPLRGRPLHLDTWLLPRYFNPRPLAGATSGCQQHDQAAQFQSTPPCGGDMV